MEILFTMTGACATQGGIAAANRNILRALARLSQDRRLPFTVYSFLEKDSDRPAFLPPDARFLGYCGSKARLAIALAGRAFTRPLLCFDHVTLSAPALPFSRLGAVKTIIFAHGSEATWRMRRSSRWSFESAALTLTNSNFTLNRMRRHIEKLNGAACPLGLTPEIQLNESIPPVPPVMPALANANGERRFLGSRVLLLAGRMHPQERRKGHLQMLGVWPGVVRQFPDAQLVFVGPGQDAPYHARNARERGVGDSVFVPGEVSLEILQTLYAGCHAFTMPSKQEGFGLVYLEAMNFGKPCLGCFDDGAEDVIVHEETGLLIRDQDSAEELTGALRRLLRNTDESRRMGANGFHRLHAQFTAAHAQQRVYDNVARIL